MKEHKVLFQKDVLKEKKGISLMILFITIVVIIILASTIFVMLSTTNPIEEGKIAKFQYDRDSMQSVFTSTVAKVMSKSKSTIKVVPGQLNQVTNGVENATGEAHYIVNYPQKDKVSNGTITFDKGKNEDGSFYTGKQLPIYNEETVWHVDDDGILTLKVGDQTYGEGKVGDIIKDFTLIGNTNSVIVKVQIAEDEEVDEYIYYIRKPGEKEWNEYRSPNNEIEIDGLEEGTRYEVKVKVVKDDKEEESNPKEVVTKKTEDTDAGKLIMKINNKNGKNYEEGTWAKDNIYLRVDGSDISYKATGANTVNKTSGESLLTNEGITTVIVTTKEGNNVVTKEYIVKIDKQPPEANAQWNVTLKEENKSDITVTLVDVRDNLSGIKDYEYYLNGQKIETTQNKIKTFENLPDGVYDVKVIITDNAGNKKEIIKSFVVGVPNANDENRVKVEKVPSTWTNQNVKLKLTYSSEDIYTPQFSEDGNTWNDVPKVYEKEITENKSVFARFIYHGDKDIAGKSKEIIIDNIDKQSPVINSVRSNNTEPTNDNITLIGKAIDTQSGIEYFQFSTENNLTSDSQGWKQIINSKTEITETSRISENGTYYFYVKDAVGNVSKEEIIIDNIDREPPEITSFETTSSSEITNGDIVLTAKAIDRKSGIVAYQFSTSKNLNVNSGGWTTIEATTNEITQTYNIAENGTYYFYVKDAADNMSKKELVIDNIDREGPTDTPPQLISNTNSITATITQTDDNGIDKDTIKFAIKKSNEDTWSEWIPSGGSESYTFPNLDMETSYDVKTMVSDTLGNTTESRVSTISTTSMTKPTISASNEWTNKDVDVRISYPVITGTTKQYSLDGINWTNLEDYENNIKVVVSTNNTTVYARLVDSDNQTSGNATYKVTCIDKENPIINSLESNNNVAISGNLTLTAKAKDNLSGLIAYQFSTADNLQASSTGWKSITNTTDEVTLTTEITSNGTYYIYVRDLVGNISKKEIVITNIDKDAPVISSLTSSNTNPTNQDISIIGKAQDITSGIVAYQFSTVDNLTSDSDGWIEITKTTDEIEKTNPITENGTYYFYVKDDAGNVTKRSIVIDNIDKIAPIVNIGTNGGNYKIAARYLNVDVSTKLDASDEGGSNLQTLQYQFSKSATIPSDNDPNWKNFTNNSTIVDLLEGGTYYLYTKVYDRAGNRAITVQKSNPYVINYQILYDANNGSNAPGEQIKKYGEDIVLSTTIPVREGYTFLGWDIDRRATTPKYNAGGTYSENMAPLLYAIWQSNTYTVTFDSNGGVEVDPKTLTREYNERLGDLPIPTRSGYVFTGWYTDRTDGELVNSNTLMPSENITLYAHWSSSPEVMIISNPQSVTVIEGNTFEFNVSASGNGTLNYQWYYNTTGLPEGGTRIDGATSPTYSAVATKAMNGRFYYCEVSLQIDGNTSTKACVPALLTVEDANYSITNAGKTTYYTTLAQANADAVSNGGASNGGTIVTLKNVTDGSVVIIDKTVVLDTNGKTITRDSLIAVDNSNITFTIRGTGKIVSSTNGVKNLGVGTLSLQNVTIQTTNPGYMPVSNSGSGNVLIDGTQITAASGSIGVSNDSNGVVTMNSGNINSEVYGIYNESTGTINVAGGSINAGNTLRNVAGGRVNITGGTFTSGSVAIINEGAEGIVTIDGANTNIKTAEGVVILSEGKLVEVKNGTLIGSSNVILNEGAGTVKISGGGVSTTSTSSPAIYNNSNGTIQVSAGNVITAGAGIYNTTGTISITGGNIKSTGSNAAVHNVSGIVTMTDGSISTATGIGLSNESLNDTSNVSGGTIDGASGVAISNTGVFEIKAGTIKSASNTVANIGTKTLKITGGTISSSATVNKYAVVNNSTGIIQITNGNINTDCSGVYNNRGTLTITGGNITGNGESGIAVANQTGILTINGGKIVANKGIGIANSSDLTSNISQTASVEAKVGNAVVNNGIFEIKGGTIKSGSNAVVNSGAKTMTINGGNISSTGTNLVAVYNAGSGRIDLNAGTITSNGSGVVNNTGTVIVNGANISGITGSGVSNEAGNVDIIKGTISCAALGVKTMSGAITNISGGTITAGTASTQGNAIMNTETGKVTITGGNISTTQGIVMFNEGSGTIKVNNPTANINAGRFPVLFNKGSGTIEVNSGTYKSTGMHVIENSTTGTIKVTGGNMSTNDDYAVIDSPGSGIVTVSGGNLTAQRVAIYTNAGRTTITGGTISGGEKAGYVSDTEQRGFTLVKNESGTLNISSGTINAVGFAIYNVKEPSNTTVTGGSVTSQTFVAMYVRYGTITVGSASSALSTSNPIITGETIGVENEDSITGSSTGTFNFYNGIIRGGEKSYEGSITKVRTGATLTNGTSGGYQATYYR